MKGYIAKALFKYGHPIPKKPQLSPHKHREVIYGANEQLAPEDLLVDNFGIEYVGKENALHLLKTLEVDYEITTDQEGENCRNRPRFGLSCPARQ